MAKIVVVTGSGVGRATVEEFARHGFHVALLSRDANPLELAAEMLHGHGGRALTTPTDVADMGAADAKLGADDPPCLSRYRQLCSPRPL